MPIPKLGTPVITGMEQVRSVFQIEIRPKGGDVLDLTDDEYIFFFGLLAEYAISFCHDPQTRLYNDPETAGHREERLGGRMPPGRDGGVITELDLATVAFLTGPKFGCTLHVM